MSMWSIVQKGDAELLADMDHAEVAEQILVPAQELIRRGLLMLNKSSRSLEKLTKWLIGLTIALTVVTVILAVPEFRHLVSWLSAH